MLEDRPLQALDDVLDDDADLGGVDAASAMPPAAPRSERANSLAAVSEEEQERARQLQAELARLEKVRPRRCDKLPHFASGC